jgi:hypothetical protein
MPTGVMIAGEVPPPVQPTPPAMGGSPIQAAAGVLQDKELVMAGAVKNLGGGSRRRRRRGRGRKLMGGGDVQVTKLPTMVSAGGADPKATYGGLLQLQHAATAAGVYDNLGGATPMNMNATTGGRRKRSRRRNNGRNKRSAKLRSRRTRRRTRHVRSSRR